MRWWLRYAEAEGLKALYIQRHANLDLPAMQEATDRVGSSLRGDMVMLADGIPTGDTGTAFVRAGVACWDAYLDLPARTPKKD